MPYRSSYVEDTRERDLIDRRISYLASVVSARPITITERSRRDAALSELTQIVNEYSHVLIPDARGVYGRPRDPCSFVAVRRHGRRHARSVLIAGLQLYAVSSEAERV